MGDAKKYELRPRMRFEALLLVLACQSIRAEVVDYGESIFATGQEKILI